MTLNIDGKEKPTPIRTSRKRTTFEESVEREQAAYEAEQRGEAPPPEDAPDSPPEATVMGTGYENGEVVDRPVKRTRATPAPKPETPPPGNQYMMPSFEGLRMDAVVVNLAGAVELNYGNQLDRILGDSFMLGHSVQLLVTGVVKKRGAGVALDSEREIKEGGKRYTTGITIYEVSAVPEAPAPLPAYDSAADFEANARDFVAKLIAELDPMDDTFALRTAIIRAFPTVDFSVGTGGSALDAALTNAGQDDQ